MAKKFAGCSQRAPMQMLQIPSEVGQHFMPLLKGATPAS